MATSSESPLVDRTNALLKTFHDHPFKAHELKAAVPLRATTPYDPQQTENLTRFTQDATNMTGLTGVSDSGLVVDPEDRDKAVEDLAEFKQFISTLKFAYLESNTKLQFIDHVISKDGPRLVTLEDNNELEKERVRTKAELKARKNRAAELEALIRAEAELLDSRLQQSEEEAATAAQLLKDCETMEMEIAMLKTKRSDTERITIDEALVLQDDQLNKMASIGPKTRAANEKITATRANLKQSRLTCEKLDVQIREMRKEQEDRELKGTRDERAEEGCRWITNATKLYSALLGVRSAYVVGTPPTEMIVEYDRTGDDFRTLSIAFGPDGRMTGARLVDSSDDISDIVEAHLPSQDMRSLVQEVRARIAR